MMSLGNKEGGWVRRKEAGGMKKSNPSKTEDPGLPTPVPSQMDGGYPTTGRSQARPETHASFVVLYCESGDAGERL